MIERTKHDYHETFQTLTTESLAVGTHATGKLESSKT